MISGWAGESLSFKSWVRTQWEEEMWQEGALGIWGIKGLVDIIPGDGSSRQGGTAWRASIMVIAAG